MRVRTTIILLLLLAVTAFVAGLYKVRQTEAEKFDHATDSLRATWKNAVGDFWTNQGKQLEEMVKNVPAREGVVAAILNNDAKWAEANWDDSVLLSYGANALWVYRRDGTLFYSHANTQTADLQKSPVPPEALEKIFGREPTPTFYFPIPSSIPGNLRFVEVRGNVVRPQWDTQRQQPAEGYCLSGRIWDDEALRQSLPPALSAGGTEEHKAAQFVSANQTPDSLFSRSRMQEVLALRDWQGRDVGGLLFSKEDPQLRELDVRGDRIFRTLLVGALGLFVLLLLVLDRAVVHPLRRVIESLHREKLSLLEPLRRQKAEFGELARLIDLFFRQRTELQESEDKLRHSQKMEAVGRLAGGVAHDFNNLLTAIIGYADVLQQRLAHDPVDRRSAELIHQAGEQAAGLTRQLLAFSRKQLLQPRVIDLNVIIANLERLLQRIIGEHIEIVTEFESTLACVKADPGQIEQVIVNLGVNARDAMPRGGRLIMRTKRAVFSDAPPVSDLSSGAYITLEVVDTGEGMDAETKARIFEPFFTTKGPGKGTGLGLATVYGIVKQSRGGIGVESERGQGSTFSIYLPEEIGPPEAVTAAPTVGKVSTREESILIVEDEEIVRDLICEILRTRGYRVLATNRGHEALRLIQGTPVDLLISDVVMPEMNGVVLAQRIHEVGRSTRILFISGYSENDMADQGLEALAFQVLQKPFTPETLARKVREVLDGGS